jgi:CubicO group peptidase (beta-lactamase class C family)
MKADIRKEIDKIIYYDTEINAKTIPGFLIGLIYEDSIFIYDYGYADLEQSVPLSDSSVFEIGGLSKVFTALLVDILVEDSLLQYQQSVNSLLDSIDYNESLSSLTVLDLISHQSGFPKLPYEFGVKEKDPGNPYAHYAKEDLLAFYRDFQAERKAKRRYAYSKVNYALLEIIIERASGETYESLLAKHIFQPLGMTNSFVHNDIAAEKKPIPGFSLSGNLAKPFDFQSFAASEGIKSSMADLMKFVFFNLYPSDIRLNDNLKRICKPVVDTKLNKQAKAAKGWHVLELRKYHNAILHSGSTNGHRSFIGFIPETRTGVAVLSNSENSIDGLGFLILRMLNYNWKKPKD